MARRKVRTKDLKKQRWAGIVAAILAVGMILSLAGVYIGQAVSNRQTVSPEQQGEIQPEEYLAHYEAEVERLESYLAEHEGNEALYLELAENYQYLTFIQQIFFDDQAELESYRSRMAEVYEELIALDPANGQYRLELVGLYLEQEDQNEEAEEAIASLQDTLREHPDPLVHLSLISLLTSTGDEEQFEQEVLWLNDYLGNRYGSGQATSEEGFYYAVLLGEYLGNPAEAEEVIAVVLEQEAEESVVHQEALNYLEYLQNDAQ